MADRSSPALHGRLSYPDACRRLLDLAAEPDGEAISDLLACGRQLLAVDQAYMTQIEGETDYWEIVQCTDGSFTPGQTTDLADTYCRQVIETEMPVAVDEAEEDQVSSLHQAVQAYLGVPLWVSDELFGTVCFVAVEPREVPFNMDEQLFARQLSHELGRFMEREDLVRKIARRDQLSAVLRRIIRHNLRNDLTVIQGRAELLDGAVPPRLQDNVDAILRKASSLGAMTEKSRHIEEIRSRMNEQTTIDVRGMIDEVVVEVAHTHAQAHIETDVPAMTIRGSPVLERGFFELVENAVQHGKDPVRISGEAVADQLHMRITDEGPGLPPSERQIFRGIRETSLDHGSGLGLWLAYWIFDSHDGEMALVQSDAKTQIEVQVPIAGSPSLEGRP